MKSVSICVEGVTAAEPNTTSIDIVSLDTLEDASCDQIYVQHTLDYVLDRDNVMLTILQKMRHGGTIQIIGTEIIKVARDTITQEIDITQINQLLYNNKLSISSLYNVSKTLNSHKLTILSMRQDGYSYSITAQRN